MQYSATVASILGILLISRPVTAFESPVFLMENAKQADLKSQPVTFVVPVPYSEARDPSKFRLVDANGKEVPAQFDVLNRWYKSGRPDYIQHLLVNAQADFAKGARAKYFVKEGAPAATTEKVTAKTDADGSVTVETGPLKFTVRKNGFNLFDRLSLNGQEIISSSPQNGGVMTLQDAKTKQLTSGNANVTLEIEESGPLRVVLKVFGATAYTNKADFTHGFRCRIYAYAGKPYVQVDFTLRNTPHSDISIPAGPMYFTDFSLEQKLNLGDNAATKVGGASGPVSAASVSAGNADQKADGWIDVFDGKLGLFAMVRNFWQQYPKENKYVAADKKLKLGLWPAGYPDYYYPGGENTRTPANVYWLDDGMQKTYQTLYVFHDKALDESEMTRLAAVFKYPPLGSVPRANWDLARTLSEGGFIPPVDRSEFTPKTDYSYGWIDYSGATDRKLTGGAGDMPQSNMYFIASGNPDAYFQWEPWYLMETDVRSSHMDNLLNTLKDSNLVLETGQYYQYDYKDPPWNKSHTDAAYDAGTGHRFGTWDTQHMWVYPFYEMYLVNGDPRIRDFYDELGRFMAYELAWRSPRALRLWGPPGNTARAYGHALAALSLAYRVTGDTLFHSISKSWIDFNYPMFDHKDGSYLPDQMVPYMEGYYARALINFTENCGPQDEVQKQKAINMVNAFIDGILNWCWAPGKGMCYNRYDSTTALPTDASNASAPMGDPMAWWYLQTGYPRYKDSLLLHMKNAPTYLTDWKGDYTGRLTTYVQNFPLADPKAPGPITDLTIGADSKLTFTSKGGKGYVIRWYTKPIRDTHFDDMTRDTTNQINWWAANVSPSWASPLPEGQKQTIDLFDVPGGTTAYVMVITIGSNGVWSKGSNVVSGKITALNPSDGKWPIPVRPEKKKPSGRLRMGVRAGPFSGDGAVGIDVEGIDGLGGSGAVRLAVYDFRGRKAGSLSPPAESGTRRLYTWRPQGSSPGMYFAVARWNGGSASMRFVY